MVHLLSKRFPWMLHLFCITNFVMSYKSICKLSISKSILMATVVDPVQPETVGRFTIHAIEGINLNNDVVRGVDDIFLRDISSGWGNGKHPTTRLCLKFVNDNVKAGNSFLDYGTGSGILSVLAAKLSASRILAVDVDDEAIRAAKANAVLNNVQDIVEVVHTREIYVGDDRFSRSDITVSNILPGPLTRLVAPLWYLTKPGGLLCLSGMRPAQLPAIQRIYEPYVDRSTEKIDFATHHEWGDWVSWEVRTKELDPAVKKELQRKLTEESMMDG